MRSDYPRGPMPALGSGLVLAAAVIAALGIGVAALLLPTPVSVRLAPGLVPGVLAAVVLGAALVSALPPRCGARDPDAATTPAPEQSVAPAGLRPLLAAALAVAILAFGTRPLGIALTAFLSASLAAVGAVGVAPARALRIGLSLSAATCLLFALALRQPLPILPPFLQPLLQPFLQLASPLS